MWTMQRAHDRAENSFHSTAYHTPSLISSFFFWKGSSSFFSSPPGLSQNHESWPITARRNTTKAYSKRSEMNKGFVWKPFDPQGWSNKFLLGWLSETCKTTEMKNPSIFKLITGVKKRWSVKHSSKDQFKVSYRTKKYGERIYTAVCLRTSFLSTIFFIRQAGYQAPTTSEIPPVTYVRRLMLTWNSKEMRECRYSAIAHIIIKRISVSNAHQLW